jgi:4-alpha-glucanotransferase
MPESNLSKYLLTTSSGSKWEKFGIQKRAGVLVPLFSVYSKNSAGLADFSDLKLIIDWAKNTGNSIIQLLPMNEVGSLFCPYDSISSFALEPVYASIPSSRTQNLKQAFSAPKQYVDYSVKVEKIKILHEIFLSVPEVNIDVERFKEENSYWLSDFSLYKVLKDFHKGAAWWEWEDRYKNRDKQALENFGKEYEKEIHFQIWVQWFIFTQFKDVKEYAMSKKVLLKGDLPILVSRDSADVWSHPEYFKLEFAAGAPPDMYCAKGQRWGMPTYNWERISQDNYVYLKQKLRYAENFYDLLRIDHVMGLFRIWSIPYNEPLDNQGLNGFFDPGDENKWGQQGRTILSIILTNTTMLLCAEDLGIIPKICPDTLHDLGILGNDVQRWVKDWNIRHDFIKSNEYRELSVAMLSTHDTTNWAAWWENEAGTVDEELFKRRCNERGINYEAIKPKLFNKAYSRHKRLRWLVSVDSVDKLSEILGKKIYEISDFADFYLNTYQEKEKLWKYLGLKGKMREKSDAEIVKAVLKISLNSRAVFCINTIVDYLYLDDVFKGDSYRYRINFPGTISDKNWSLVMPISLEELLKHKVNKEIHRLILDSGRT